MGKRGDGAAVRAPFSRSSDPVRGSLMRFAGRGRSGSSRGHVLVTAQKKKGLQNLQALDQVGAPGRIRTSDPLVRSQVLYPTELRAQRNGRGF